MKYISKLFTKQALITGLLVVGVIVLFGYSSYALFMRVDRYDPIQAMSFGDLGVSFAIASESGIPNHLALKNMVPMSDTDATNTSYDGNKYSFALTNYGLESSDYKVYLVPLEEQDLVDATSSFVLANNIPYKYIKLQIDNNAIVKLSELKDGLICSGEVKYGEENILYHDLRIWLSSDYQGEIKNIDFKLKFESILQSENIKKNSIATAIIKDNGSDTISGKTYDLTVNETGNNSGLFYDRNDSSYFFRGSVTNNNIVFGKDESSNDIMWKIISVNNDEIKMVLNNSTMIKELKTPYDSIEKVLGNWFLKFANDQVNNAVVLKENKAFTTLTYSDLNKGGIVLGTANQSFFLSAKINYWVLSNDKTYGYYTNAGIIETSQKNSLYVLPVVSIKGSLKYDSGTGTEDSPYRFIINEN